MSTRLLFAARLAVVFGFVQTAISGTIFYHGPLICEDLGSSIRVGECQRDSVDVVIPETINAKPVTVIGDQCFFFTRRTLKTVSIPETVTSIGNSAFAGCTELTSLTIPAGLTHLGSRAFADCESLSTPLAIPSGVTAIGPETFYRCGSLKAVVLHQGINHIGAGAFEFCGLLEFETPPKVTVFTERMLRHSDVETLSLPGHVTRIEKDAISGTPIRSIVIPKHVDFVFAGAFMNCRNLRSVTILREWTAIAPSMFEGCVSLRSFVAPASVLSVGERAFADSGLVSIKLPSVRTIGSHAFSNCKFLASLPLPKSLRSIGNYAFIGCRVMQGLHFAGNAPKMGVGVFFLAHPRTVFYVEENSKGFTYPRWYGHRVSLPRGEIDIYTADGPLDTEGKAALKAGSVRVGTLGAPLVIFIRNTGNRPLTGIRASVVGSAARDFLIKTATPSIIQPGQSVRVGMMFKPTKAMSRQAKLVIKSADLDEGLIEVSMTGTGVTVL